MSKPKKKLMNEYMKKFGMLVEYNYNIPAEDETKNLLLDEEDEELGPDDFGIETDDEVDSEESSDVADFGGEDDVADFGGEDDVADFGGEDDVADFGGEDEPDVEVSEDGIELDVTDIVTSTEEAKEISTAALNKIDSILNSFSALEDRLNGLEDITNKIDSLEQEFEKRNPTDVEKMELRSLDSYPYNLKLTDFWTDKEGYDVGTPSENTDEGTVEYKLTDDAIDSTYNETDVKDGFKNDEEEDMI